MYWLAQGNLDGYHDMLENYAWAQAWDWGTHKHPPLFAWVVGLWFAVFPQTDLAYRLLSYTNVALGLWGILHLAGRLGLRALAPTAVLLLLWSFPYANLAAKFNANSQLLSLWPWTAAMLLASWQERGLRGSAYSMALGLLAAASMLSKYYSGVFLAGFLLPTLLTAAGRQWLLSPRPYLALAVFGAALAPHIAWIAGHNWVTLGYAMDQGSGATQWGYVLRFTLAPLFYWLPGWLACVTVFSWMHWRTHASERLGQVLVRFALQSWRPTGWADTLFWLACTPWALTLAFGIAGIAELSTPWAIPIGFAFSLLWLRNLQTAAPAVTVRALVALHRAFWPALAAVVLVGLTLAWANGRSGNPDYYRPSAEAAEAIAQDWAKRHPNTPVGWVGGAWAENALLAFYALPNARTLPGLPDAYPALFNPYPRWSTEAGILLCPRGMQSADGAAPAPEALCEDAARSWLQAQGQATEPRLIKVQRHGWRFPQPRWFVYAVFDVLPLPASRLP
ncbi:MAG: glycosyltransferase family 39 protein [Burkholderiaceae bacterium]|nr:glycosyltransferase family 39 protein [Burkholderiaceae bacterium]